MCPKQERVLEPFESAGHILFVRRPPFIQVPAAPAMRLEVFISTPLSSGTEINDSW